MLTETRPALTTTTGQFQDPTYFTQTPRVEYSDEGSLAITSYQDRVIADVVTNSENEWNTCVTCSSASLPSVQGRWQHTTSDARRRWSCAASARLRARHRS